MALARKTGVELPKEESPSPEDSLKEKIYRVNQMAAQYYHYCLTRTEAGKGPILAAPGITSESVKLFQLGYAPGVGRDCLTLPPRRGAGGTPGHGRPGRSAGAAVTTTASGAGSSFPSITGRPSGGLRGRIRKRVRFRAQYLNSPETPVLKRGRSLRPAPGQGRDPAPGGGRGGRVYRCNHPLPGRDKNVVLPGNGPYHMQGRLLRTQTDVVFIAYDADSAGKRLPGGD